jgi:heme A synthase
MICIIVLLALVVLILLGLFAVPLGSTLMQAMIVAAMFLTITAMAMAYYDYPAKTSEQPPVDITLNSLTTTKPIELVK